MRYFQEVFDVQKMHHEIVLYEYKVNRKTNPDMNAPSALAYAIETADEAMDYLFNQDNR